MTTGNIQEHQIPIDPHLPDGFDDTPNAVRPESHQEWWFRPYIMSCSNSYHVECLDGGAWDRPTAHGAFDSLDEALTAAKELAQKYSRYREMDLREAYLQLWFSDSQVAEIIDGKVISRPMTKKDVRI